MNSRSFLIITTLATTLIGSFALPAQNTPAPQPNVIATSPLNDFERSLIGTWYYGGVSNQTCYIASSGNLLFAITTDRRTSRILCNPDGFFLADEFERGLRAEVLPEKILWSNGTWWSRHPSSGAGPRKS